VRVDSGQGWFGSWLVRVRVRVRAVSRICSCRTSCSLLHAARNVYAADNGIGISCRVQQRAARPTTTNS
jgi:hypothetical protein